LLSLPGTSNINGTFICNDKDFIQNNPANQVIRVLPFQTLDEPVAHILSYQHFQEQEMA
jgi:hypothetical protein